MDRVLVQLWQSRVCKATAFLSGESGIGVIGYLKMCFFFFRFIHYIYSIKVSKGVATGL